MEMFDEIVRTKIEEGNFTVEREPTEDTLQAEAMQEASPHRRAEIPEAQRSPGCSHRLAHQLHVVGQLGASLPSGQGALASLYRLAADHCTEQAVQRVPRDAVEGQQPEGARMTDERLREFAVRLLFLDHTDWSAEVEAAVEILRELLREAQHGGCSE